jgi:hypothetical protein
MTLIIEKISDTKIWIHDGSTSIMEIDTTDGVRVNGDFKIGTASLTTELGILNDVTASAAEINLIDGSVAGTAVASKALALGSNKEADEIHAVALYTGAGAGTLISRTAAQINLLTQGVAAGYKIARGIHTTVDENDTVVTGLATVVAVVASLDSDPVAGAQFVTASIGDQAGSPAAGSILIKTWKATAAGDTALIAATTFSKLVGWIAIGT